MKIQQLNPFIQGGYPPKYDSMLYFDCPIHGKDHHVAITIGGEKGWKVSNSDFDYENLTVTPSVQVLRNDCNAHFFITNGEIVMCG